MYTTHLSILILAIVFLLISVRQLGRYTFRIWQVMLAGAVLVLVTGQITLVDALHSINPGVMLFLLSMFVIGEGVYASGMLGCCLDWICRTAKSGDSLLLLLVGSLGFFSAVFMNDTVAVIATPLVIALADRFSISRSAAILALCFSVTTGSVCSPIGNPQNYLIASYVPEMSPFILFGAGLFVPTVISLGLIWVVLRRSFRKAVPPRGGCTVRTVPENRTRVAIYLSLCILLLGIVSRVIVGVSGSRYDLPIEWIAFAAAVPVLLLALSRMDIVRRIDWRTLVFFAAMFVLMQSVYDSGFFQDCLPFTGHVTVPWIFSAGVLLSQLISNVPFVALFQPAILSEGISRAGVLALVAGSTIAGNLTILGAASNVIVLQKAELESVHISMKEFCSYGVPLTFCQSIIYILYLIGSPL